MKHYTKADWQWWAARACFGAESLIMILLLCATFAASISLTSALIWSTALTLVYFIFLTLTAIGFYADIDWSKIADGW